MSKEVLQNRLHGQMAALLCDTRRIAYLVDRSRLLCCVRLALHPVRQVLQSFPRTLLFLSAVLLMWSLIGCSKGGDLPTAGIDTVKQITFINTQDGAPFKIDPALFDTPAAKEFLASGKNPYNGNAEAIIRGKKVFQLYSCTQCHGPMAGGQVGPSLLGPNFRYAKNATDKGMFEIIWHGTNGGMGAKGIGLMDPSKPTEGISPDDMLKTMAWIRSLGSGYSEK